MATEGVIRFEDSVAYQEGLEFIHHIVMRGRNSQSLEVFNQQHRLNNHFTEAQNDIQIMNYIAYGCGRTLSAADLSRLPTEEKYDILAGNVSIVLPEDRGLFERIVSRMPHRRFLLIPFFLGMKASNEEWKSYKSLLMKSQRAEGADNTYVDLMGRVYQTFRNFLNENNFPCSLLVYPGDGILTINDGQVMLATQQVGVRNTVLSITDATMAGIGLFSFIFPITGALSAVWLAGRGIQQLYDAHQHGESINPTQNANALVMWLQVAGNLLHLASFGLQYSEILRDYASLYQKATPFFNVTVVTLDIILTNRNWDDVAVGDRIAFGTAMCFAYHTVFTMENFIRVIENVRFDTLCNTILRFVGENFNRRSLQQFLERNYINILTLLNFLKDLICKTQRRISPASMRPP